MDMEMQNLSSDQRSPAGLGFWGKFINIYTNPSKTFAELINRPTWLMPLVIMIILSAILTYAAFPIAIQSQLESFRSNPNISAEQLKMIEARYEQAGSIQRIIGSVSLIIVFPILYLILAGIFYLTGSVILGGDCTFKKVLSVWSWSTLIGVLAIIIKTPLVFLKQNMQIAISPALLLPGDSIDSTLYIILSQFDFFTIWQLAVFAFGFGMIYKFSNAKSYIAVGALWAIWIVIAVVGHSFLKNIGLA
jgi:hypothetical protein